MICACKCACHVLDHSLTDTLALTLCEGLASFEIAGVLEEWTRLLERPCCVFLLLLVR